MNRILLMFISIVFALPTFAQKGFETAIPDEPVDIVADSGSLSVEGHWVALDDHSRLTGPSVSKIICDRRQCIDSLATIIVNDDGTFQLVADSNEYAIERWTSREVVASTVSGLCKVREVLKFDLVGKRVFYMRTLSEPVDAKMPELSKKLCSESSLNLELKRETEWKISKSIKVH